MATILDQPWQIELYHLNVLKYALKIEVNTGLRHSKGSVLDRVNDTLVKGEWIDQPYGSKKTALEALESYIREKERQAMGNMDEEVITLLFDYLWNNVDGKSFRERNEEKEPVIGIISIPVPTWERLGRPESINVQLRRVL